MTAPTLPSLRAIFNPDVDKVSLQNRRNFGIGCQYCGDFPQGTVGSLSNVGMGPKHRCCHSWSVA